ncbi:Tethering factor for nuclear proteasome sts1 [Borealophlyctis nickersoniae]|nr:Tethering factor for nuclear proteasome sts1 [Borealophlyctis nickersoniae]
MAQTPNPLQHTFGFSASRPSSQSPARNRKRKNDTEEEAMDESSPVQSGGGAGGFRFVPTKRSRTGSVDTAVTQRLQQPHQPSIQVSQLLSSLDKDQLISILSSLMANHPSLDQEVAALLPRPTLASATSLLSQAEKRLADAYPYSKWGPDRTSDYAFNRVRPHLADLRTLLLHHLDHFVQPSSYPPQLQHELPVMGFGYLHLATGVAHRMPNWQTQAHTGATKGDVYERLARAWRSTIAEVGRRVKEEGKVFGAAVLGEWARNLHHHSNEVKGAYGFEEACQEFRKHLGWLIGMYPVDGSGFDNGGVGSIGGVPGHMHYPTNVMGLGMSQFPVYQQQI